MRLTAFVLGGTLLLVVLQSVLAPTVRIGPVVPDFYLMFVVYLVGLLSAPRALFAAWALGLVRDCLTPAPLGVDAFAMLLVAALLLMAHRRFVFERVAALAMFTFIGGLVHGAVWAAAMHIGGAGLSFDTLFLRIGIPVALYSAAVMPVFAWLADGMLGERPSYREVRIH